MFLLRLLWAVVRGVSTRRANLVAENLALRQQLIVLHRKAKVAASIVLHRWADLGGIAGPDDAC